MPRKNHLKGVKKIVIKVGTSTIAEDGKLSRKKISRIADGVASLIKRGYHIVVVSSGAITAGAGALNKKKELLTIPERQALAAVGQSILINEYRASFRKRGLDVGQILLTEDDIKNRMRYLNARNTFHALLHMGVVPIVNENDSVVVKEIKFGDNDTLSAYVTSLVDADLLILLSDVDGFYMDLGDPSPVDEITEITEDILARAKGSGSSYGTGGMYTKILAAELIIRFGEMMIIARGSEKNVLARIMKGERIGTIFTGKDRSLGSRKKWLALRKANGFLTIDDGAVRALQDGKKSLLASGILSAQGEFDMGDPVEISSAQGRLIGKGIVNYSRDELVKIKGKKSQEIKKILGSKYFDEVINRDDLILY